MRSAGDCISKAAELSTFAEGISEPLTRALVLAMARTWLDLSALAEWQNEFGPGRTYRIR